MSVNPRLGGGADTDRELNWVRAGAGDRFDAITRSVSVYLVVRSDDPDRIARQVAARADVDPVKVLENPHVLIGTQRQICDTLQRRRDRWGFTQVVIDELRAQELARSSPNSPAPETGRVRGPNRWTRPRARP